MIASIALELAIAAKHFTANRGAKSLERTEILSQRFCRDPRSNRRTLVVLVYHARARNRSRPENRKSPRFFFVATWSASPVFLTESRRGAFDLLRGGSVGYETGENLQVD
jgi:hypothetical protein